MSEPDVEVALVANGSIPLEDKGTETVPENEGRGGMKDSEERKDGEEKKDSKEKKDGEQNGGGREEDEGEGNVEKKTEDVDMAETGDAEDVDKSGKEDEGEEEEKPNRDSKVKEDKEVGDGEKKLGENQDVEVSKRKRARRQKVSEKGNKKEKKGTGTKVMESPKTPAPSTIERPVRERKTVERLVEAIEKEPNKGFQIEKGRGTPLKDIPNVAYKLARKKAADLKLLHQTLFGRKGKTINFKSHILQFSGFPWHESDEKQRAKMKEKLDKYVKDTLVDMCDLFDIPVVKATTKKEDLVVKILDFMLAPHATTDVVLAEKDQSSKSRKRKRVAKGSTSKITEGMSAKRSRKKRTKDEGMQDTKGKKEEMEDEDNEEDENGVHDEDESLKNSDSDEREKELEEEEEEDDDEHSKNGKRDMKKSSKQRGSSRKEKMKVGTSPKKALVTIAKSPSKSSPSKHLVEESNDVGAKVFSRKKKNDETPRTKSRSKPDKKEKTTGKRTTTGKGKSEEAKQSGPSKDELRNTICEILKEVDFNTATFTDILKQLAAHYKMDLTSRKSSIKLMIQEELTKLADEAEENEDDEDDEVAEKGDNPKPAGKELET